MYIRYKILSQYFSGDNPHLISFFYIGIAWHNFLAYQLLSNHSKHYCLLWHGFYTVSNANSFIVKSILDIFYMAPAKQRAPTPNDERQSGIEGGRFVPGDELWNFIEGIKTSVLL